jgi:cytochrome c-type biogenesis protein CcmH/NrfG
MGQKHVEAKRYPLAAAAAQKAIGKDAKLVDAYVLLGQAQAAQGDCKSATAAFDKGLALDKNNAAAEEGKKACAK